MKNKVLFLIIALSLMLSACGPDKDECNLQWHFLTYDSDLSESLQIQMILNNEWPSASTGAFLQKCLRNGWLPDDE